MSKVLRGSVKREPMFAVGEVVWTDAYGKGIVREVGSGGYMKIVFESDEHNWAAWWFTPQSVTKLQIDWIGEANG